MNHASTDYMAAFFGPISPKPWPAFRAELLELYKPPHRAKATYAGMTHALGLIEDLGIESTSDLSVPLVGRLLAGRPNTLSPNSLRGTLRYVSAACSYAEKMCYLRPSPFRIRSVGDWVRPVPPARKQFASREDIRKVIDHAAALITGGGWREWKARRTHALLCTLALSGARYSEIVWMQTADIDLALGTIAIVSRREHRLKTAGAHAMMPCHADLVPTLRSWLEHRMSVPPKFKIDDPECPWLFPTLRRHKRVPWTSGGPGQRPSSRVSVLAAEVGVRLNPQMLRHSFATHVAAEGAGQIVVQQLLRHSNIQTQKYYVHQDLEQMRAAASKLTY
jgi:integrase